MMSPANNPESNLDKLTANLDARLRELLDMSEAPEVRNSALQFLEGYIDHPHLATRLEQLAVSNELEALVIQSGEMRKALMNLRHTSQEEIAPYINVDEQSEAHLRALLNFRAHSLDMKINLEKGNSVVSQLKAKIAAKRREQSEDQPAEPEATLAADQLRQQELAKTIDSANRKSAELSLQRLRSIFESGRIED